MEHLLATGHPGENGRPSAPPAGERPIRMRIEPTRGWKLLDLPELVAYRDLLWFLVLRDVKVLYKQTVLGFSWAILPPVFQMILFSVVFGGMAKMESEGVPYALFSYVALVPWTYFSASMTAATTSLVSNADMLTKVYFPRLVIPLTSVLAKLVDFAIAFAIVFVLMAWYRIAPAPSAVFLPVLVFVMVVTAAGLGMWLSALTLQYRDIKHGVTFLAQLMMYAAPVVWPVSLIAEEFGPTARLLYGLYPMAGVIDGFRATLLGTRPMPWDLVGIGMCSAGLLFLSGAFAFKRMERRFADVA
jgi:lipopolysaccharide transport system permease protein